MRQLAALDHLPHDRHPRGAQQLLQLAKVITFGQRRDAERPLNRALLRR
jgi:hypothetical protein